METSEFADHVRAHRSSGAVLKTRVSNIRSRDRTALIAIVEGVSDVAPYEVWIARIFRQLAFEFVPGAGKSQLLDFRRRMKNDRSGLVSGIYLFIDRDFDGLRGQQEGDDIFCTERYSIENYFEGFSLCFRSHQMLIGLLRSRHGSWTVPGDVRELLDLGKLVSSAVRQAGGPALGPD